MTSENESIVQVSNPFGTSSNFELAQRVAKGLASSSLVPESYQGNVPNTLIAMEISQRIGASIFAVMQHLYIVHGKPSFDSTFLIATVNSSARFTPIKYRFSGTEGNDDWGCRAWAKDRESGEECIGPLVTLGLAKREGWYDKKGSKWQTMPELMLHYRSAAFWTRIYAPELSLGMKTVEEVYDDREPIKIECETKPLEDLKMSLKKTKNEKDKKETPMQEISPLKMLLDVATQDEIDALSKETGYDPTNAHHASMMLDVLINRKENQ